MKQQEKAFLLSHATDNDEIKRALGILGTVFNELSDNIELSKVLLDKNIFDSFSRMLKEAIEDPVAASFDGFKTIELMISQLIHEITKVFINSESKLIKEAYRTDQNPGVLHYTIILKNDTQTNRARFYNYLSSYEATEYSSSYPILFQLIPPGIKESLKDELETGTSEKII